MKFLAYLDARTAETGALRVVPRSHTGELATRLATYWAHDPGASGFERWPVPGVVLETEPGDVVAFDGHLFRASAGGSERLAWSMGVPALARVGRPRNDDGDEGLHPGGCARAHARRPAEVAGLA